MHGKTSPAGIGSASKGFLKRCTLTSDQSLLRSPLPHSLVEQKVFFILLFLVRNSVLSVFRASTQFSAQRSLWAVFKQASQLLDYFSNPGVFYHQNSRLSGEMNSFKISLFRLHCGSNTEFHPHQSPATHKTHKFSKSPQVLFTHPRYQTQ